MRASLRSIPPVLVLSLAACISGSSTVRVQADPAPPPPPRPVTVMTPPAPAPQPREAVEITLARPIRGQLPIQTNRPVYVAVFEIVPEQGVTLVQPASAQRRRITPAGLTSIPVWWKGERTAAGARSESQPTRFVYVVASDQPLRLGEQAYVPGYWQRALGARAYYAANPYATMRALSRIVVPAVVEEDWGEDALALAPTNARQVPQPPVVARAYCPDGSIREVPIEFADRAFCPSRVGSSDRGRGSRPDSVFGNNGRRVQARGPRGRGPVRVSDPMTPGRGEPHYGARPDPRDARPPRRDEPATVPSPKPEEKREAKRDAQEAKRDSLEAKHEAKREAQDEKHEAKREEQETRRDAREERKEARQEEKAERQDAKEEAKAERKEARSEAKTDAKEQRQEAKEERQEAKEERKPDAKEEPKPEQREEARPETKPESKPDAKPEASDDSSSDRGGEPAAEKKGDAGDDRKGNSSGDERSGKKDDAGRRPARSGKPQGRS